MSQLTPFVAILQELRQPKPGQEQYYMVTSDGGFYVWPDAAFLQTLQLGQNYAINAEVRSSGGKTFRTAREVVPYQGVPLPAQPPALPQYAQPAPAYQPAQLAAAAAPALAPAWYPPQPAAPAPPLAPVQTDVRLDPTGSYRSPMMMFVSEIVGRAMQSGQYPSTEISLLTAAALEAWSNIPQMVQTLQHPAPAPTGADPEQRG